MPEFWLLGGQVVQLRLELCHLCLQRRKLILKLGEFGSESGLGSK